MRSCGVGVPVPQAGVSVLASWAPVGRREGPDGYIRLAIRLPVCITSRR